MVAEYTTDELAEDSGDEKWLNKSVRAAKEKAVTFNTTAAAALNAVYLCLVRFTLVCVCSMYTTVCCVHTCTWGLFHGG